MFPKEKLILKPGEWKIVKIEAPFSDEISSLAIIKLLDKLMQRVIVLKVKFIQNTAVLDMVNNSNLETLILNPGEALGILDLRSLGYYKIQQGVIKQKLSKFYTTESAFSLGDEIGMCPNTEVRIEVTDKSPFFIRPHHVREEDKKVIDKEMKRLCYLGILKEGFLPYSSLVMLNSHKLTQDKREVMDFRHLNIRIAKII